MRSSLLAITLLLLTASGAAHAADRDVLWKIIDTGCVPGSATGQMPPPCTRVEMPAGREFGWAVMKDRRGVLQYLLLPTARISGVESPELLKPGTPNFFAQAWQARDLLDQLNGRPLPRDALSLTLNPVRRRTQDQFHIHISCVRPELQARLQAAEADIASEWSPLAGGWRNHSWLVRRVDGDRLDSVNPIVDVATHMPGALDDMGAVGVGVVAMTFKDGRPGFVLMATHRDDADATSGLTEHDIQDHDCAVVKAAAPAPAAQALPATQ
ncbi:MAG: CDP-diacylglycerol diphosphatase [Burkholderiales bacterium]|jgi:CDP-diacylglycerol pyrophosphatase|nr:CDP-diacylglycerol diphosphatase [Burkholderiales bacterium]